MSTFEEAAKDAQEKLNPTLSNEELLELYALFKQASVGDVNTSRPGFMDQKGRHKWDAWEKKKGMSQEEAKQKYVEYVASLKAKHGTKA